MGESKEYFAYPKYNIGFHSGWSESDIDQTGFFCLTKRRECTATLYTDISNKPPCYIKAKGGEKTGLSSGAGSFIYKHKGKFYKVKRAGYRMDGIITDRFEEKGFIDFTTATEVTYPSPAGLLEFDEAQQEFEVYDKLQQDGFFLPQKPIKFYENISNKIEDRKITYGSLVFEIESDFRCDELLMCIIVNILSKHFTKENFNISLDRPSIQIKKISLIKLQKVLEHEYGDFIFSIGRAIGSNYRKIHENGYIRGIGNFWYGNDVICHDGKIGFCDMDSTSHISELKDENVFKSLQEIDINANIASMFVALYPMKSTFFEIITNILIKGFKQGYEKPTEAIVDKILLHRIINDYKKSTVYLQ